MTAKSIELNTLYQPTPDFTSSKPTAIAMALVKNEGDLIAAWLAHICELFDLIYIVDHQSTDGTREFLLDAAKSQEKIHLFSFEEPGYFQSEIINQLAQMTFQDYPDAWLFPLDADEFLPVSSKSEFTASLNKFDPDQVLLLNWQNYIPLYLQIDQQLQFNLPCLVPSKPGLYNKVAVRASTLSKKKWKIAQGNHRLETETGSWAGLNAQVRFSNLIHMPVRSVDHFTLKCIQGNISVYQLSDWRQRGPFHWHEMLNSILRYGEISSNIVRRFVASYGQTNDLDPNGISIYELIDEGWSVQNFDMAHGEIFSNAINRRNTFIELSARLLEACPENNDFQRFLQINKDSQRKALDVALWQQQGTYSRNPNFYKLPELAIQDSYQDFSEIELLQFFMSNSFMDRENPVPSTWETHIPFFYSLLNFYRPRRFVELGTHHGNCFFAACQVSKQLSYSMECIAIDTWAGDTHTGSYENEVFIQFMQILKRDYQHGKYIRKLFNDASKQFEPGSIDLLHVDGLHTYEAVSEDFANWLPMLSDRGIVMLHDTQERERGFGVWKLWAEISRKYPSFEFEHGHGLGVLLVGEHPEQHIQKLFEIASRPEYVKFMRFFFSNIGRLSQIIIPLGIGA